MSDSQVSVTFGSHATPERLFEAWSRPADVAVWMLAPAPGELVGCTVEARVGGRYSFVVRRGGEDVEHCGEYLVWERPTRLVFTWCVPRYSDEATTVAVELLATAEGTQITLSHAGVRPEYAERVRAGWTAILAAIVGLAVTPAAG